MNGLSITQKLLVMLIAPLVGLIFFAMSGILDKRAVVREMDTLNELSALAVKASELVHELQIERGVSTGYVVAEGTRFGSDVQNQRGNTDRALAEYRRTVAGVQLDASMGDLGDTLNQIANSLEALPNRRDGVSALTLRANDVVGYYTGVNAALLQLPAKIVEVVTEAEIAQRLVAYGALALAKEQAGIERALANAAFTQNRFADIDQFLQFTNAVAYQQTYERVFGTYAQGEETALLRSRVSGAVIDEFNRYRSTALNGFGAAALGVNADAWFRASTARIDLLAEVENQIARNLVDAGEALRAGAQRELLFFAILGLIVLVVAVGLAILMARSISGPLTKASDAAREVAHQIVSTSQQQSASASETATSVSQTTTTVDEIRQTSEIAATKAKAVTEATSRSASSSGEALKAISHGIDAMQRIRNEVEGIAKNILELSEKNMQIGDIVETVNAIAEQSNLLAVNASIEAAKAGEQGKGFSVVASEVKALAGQSKEAAAQIRSILATIQKSSNAAVMVTEQGTKRVEEGSTLIEELGQTIRQLGQVIEETTDSARQIAATANQQLTGIEQITGAMRNIEQATRDNAAGIQQMEQAAQQVRLMSEELTGIVNGQRIAS
jgi:methyl-accepting chemotaxis protein